MSSTCNTSISRFDTINEITPSPFNEMTIYQVCSWLCENPNILQLANNMQLSTQVPAVDGSQFMPSISSGLLTTLQNQDNKTKACRDFLEELKCLFLRAWDPPKSAFEELIRDVFRCELNSAEGIGWLHVAIKHFGDFRNKLVNGIEDLVVKFKEKRTSLVLYIYIFFIFSTSTITFYQL